jgi:hypothetical protein
MHMLTGPNCFTEYITKPTHIHSEENIGGSKRINPKEDFTKGEPMCSM